MLFLTSTRTTSSHQNQIPEVISSLIMVSIRAISALALAHQAAAFATPGRQFASRMATVPSASFYELQDTDTTGAPVDFKQVRSLELQEFSFFFPKDFTESLSRLSRFHDHKLSLLYSIWPANAFVKIIALLHNSSRAKWRTASTWRPREAKPAGSTRYTKNFESKLNSSN